MSIAISSIGVKVSVAFETESNVRPTTGYIKIPQVFSVPDLDPDPSTAETTSFDNQKNTSSRPLLQDLGILSFDARYTQDLFDLYKDANGIEAKYAENVAQGLGAWLCIDLPELNKAYFLPVEIMPLKISGFDFNSIIDNALKFTATGDGDFYNKPTYATDTLSVVTIGTVAQGDIVSVLQGGNVFRQVTATSTSVVLSLPYDTVNGTLYTFVAMTDDTVPTTKSAVANVSSATTTVSLA